MPISEAFRRGYRRAVADAAAIADRRMVVCAEAVTRFENDPLAHRSSAATERCAQREAQHIWEKILQLKPVQDRD